MTVERLFVAVWLPDPVLDLLESLPRPEDPALRWTRRDQWHVTLRFLGRAETEQAEEALAAVTARETTAVLGPRTALLGRSIVIAPVAGLDELAAEVVRATAGVGEPPDDRPFKGHVTLARARRGGRVRVPHHPLRAEFPVREVHLVRSRPGPDGSLYDTVAVRSLSR